MRFSIITVTLNSERHLAECIGSVLSQEGAELEQILVDGGSTDGTLDIVRRFAAVDPRLRWISGPDDGIADAFNKGLALATGDLIGILNSDDAFAPGALSRVAAAFAGHPECDVFHGDMERFRDDTPLFVLKPAPVGENIWYEMPVNHPATFVTRRAYDRVGRFDASLGVAMDYDLVLRLYLAGCRFHYIPAPLARMRYGGASDERFIRARLEVVAVTVREGYPRHKAWLHFCQGILKSSLKNLLRRLRLHALIRLHPRFGPGAGP